MKPSRFSIFALGVAASALVSCSDDSPDDGVVGAIGVRAYGESFIEDGIPAEAVDDGWAISFNRFDVTLSDISVAGAPLPDPNPVPLHQSSEGRGHEIGSVSVDAGTYDSPSFTIARVAVEGSAELRGNSKSFRWTFDSATRYQRCETTTQVEPDQTAGFEITVHADHLFYDSLVAEEPALRFQPLADADADADGDITAAELAETDIGAYDPGNDDVSDLWSFLVAQHRTLGHVDGEGHCESSTAD